MAEIRRRLTSIQRRGGDRTKTKMAGRLVRIWSAEHGAWWKPNGNGYTTVVEMAGIYRFDDAFARTRHCCPKKRIEYVVVSDPARARGETLP